MTEYRYGEFLNTSISSSNTDWHEQHESQLFSSWNQAFGTPYSLLARVSNFNMGNGTLVPLLDMSGVKGIVAPCFLRIQCYNNKGRTSGVHKLFVDVQKGGNATRIIQEVDLFSEGRYQPENLVNLYMSVHNRNSNITLPTTSGTSLIENVGSWPMNPPDWGTRSATTRVDTAYRGYVYPTKLVFDLAAVNEGITDPKFQYQDTQTAGTVVRLGFTNSNSTTLKVITAELYGCGVAEYL